MLDLGRVVLSLVCAWFSMVPYAHVFAYLSEHGPATHERTVMAPCVFFERMQPAVLVAALVAFPIAWMYGRAAPWVALILTVPFAALRFVLIRHEAKALELTIACAAIATYVILVTGATLIGRRQLVRRRIKGKAQSPAHA